ncbi:transcription elongation factor 1 homolog [Vanacampus margaritifer]
MLSMPGLAEVDFLCNATCVSPRKATQYFRTMGRRKSKRKPPPKKKMTGDLDTQFTCPFCNHEKSCDVKMERTRNTGIISCTVCLEEFQTPITYLSEPVDVYSDWIDACESANQ